MEYVLPQTVVRVIFFLFGTGNQANMDGYGGTPDGLVRCGGDINGTPCTGNLALKSGHVNVSGDHIVFQKKILKVVQVS